MIYLAKKSCSCAEKLELTLVFQCGLLQNGCYGPRGSFAEVGFCFTSSSGMVFTTIYAHGEVIYSLIVRSTPRGLVLQIFDGANFLVAEKHDSDEHMVGANFHSRVSFS